MSFSNFDRGQFSIKFEVNKISDFSNKYTVSVCKQMRAHHSPKSAVTRESHHMTLVKFGFRLVRRLPYMRSFNQFSTNLYCTQSGTLHFIKSHPSSCYWPAPPVWRYPTTAFFDPKALSFFPYC